MIYRLWDVKGLRLAENKAYILAANPIATRMATPREANNFSQSWSGRIVVGGIASRSGPCIFADILEGLSEPYD